MTDSGLFITCPTCGRQLDKRDLGQVLSHGSFNKVTKHYECLDEAIELPAGIAAIKVKDATEEQQQAEE